MEPIERVLHAVKEWAARKPGYDLLRDYDEGRHQLKFASPDFEEKFGEQVRSLRENMCPGVVSAFTDRLNVASWGPKVDEATAETLDRIWGLVKYEAWLCGDGYVIVWPGAGDKPVPHYHRADQIVPHVDPLDPGRLDWAAKVWVTEDDYLRVNVYDDKTCTRWQSNDKLPESADVKSISHAVDKPTHWRAYEGSPGDPGDVLRHRYAGTPVIRVRANASDQTGYGLTVLNDVVPLQDALNKSVADLVVTGESYARPFRYLLNFKPESSNPFAAAGEYMQAARQAVTSAARRRFDPQKQQIFTHDGPGPFGQLDPADLEKLVKVQDAFALKIGRVVGVPPYYISQSSGDIPSGESLRVLTSRMTARGGSFIKEAKAPLRGLVELMGFEADIEFDPVAQLDESERFDNATKLRNLGYSLEDVAEYLGHDAAEVVRRAEEETSRRASEAGRNFREGTGLT